MVIKSLVLHFKIQGLRGSNKGAGKQDLTLTSLNPHTPERGRMLKLGIGFLTYSVEVTAMGGARHGGI